MSNKASLHIDYKALKRLVNENVSDDIEVYGYKIAKAIESYTPKDLNPKATSKMTKNRKGYPVSLQHLSIDSGTPEQLQAENGVFSRAALSVGLEYGQN